MPAFPPLIEELGGGPGCFSSWLLSGLWRLKETFLLPRNEPHRMPRSLRLRQNSACPSDSLAAPHAGGPGPSALSSWSAGVHAPSWNDFISHNFLLSFLLLSHPLLIPFAPPSASCHNSHVLRAPIWTPFQRRDILKTAGRMGGVTCRVAA